MLGSQQKVLIKNGPGRMAGIRISLLLILILAGFAVRVAGANVGPDDISGRAFHYIFGGTESQLFKVLGIGREHPDLPARPVPFRTEQQKDPSGENCFFKERFKNLADRGHDSIMFFAAADHSGYAALAEPNYCSPELIAFDSNTGESWKIRPPPLD